MILSYSECINNWRSDYQIKKRIKEGKLFKIERGVYSDNLSNSRASALEVIVAKYPKSIITMNSAFYYHGLTDVIPDEICIAREQHAAHISDNRIKQYYLPSSILDMGVTTMKKRNIIFRIYDKERMLIELIRYKNRLPYDYYKEILGNYRNIIFALDIERIQEYADTFPKSKMISDTLEREVF